jgi:beta-lactam-binding protein with PASTA domain/tRNA A-37 threonylcarbamoyl transferase component Bud32
MISSGRVIGGYQVEAHVSDGGMATVYRARRVSDGKVVALKVLRDQYATDAEFVERFQREAQAVASLSHPNMVQVYESGRDDGVHFIAMEFVEGSNLKQVIRRRGGRLPAGEAVRIAAQVCDVLDYAHRRGIIHRDIKPQNILMAKDGTAKVADFGIARALSSVTITQTGTVLGSVQYLSPEQARGQSVGRPTDIYSLSVVLYEMVTGQLPFDGDSPIAIALKHIHDAPQRPRAIEPSVPEAIDAIIMRGMAKQPDRRYESARELATDLRGETDTWRAFTSSDESATIVARPTSTAATPRRVGRTRAESLRPRRRRALPTAAVLSIMIVGLLTGGLFGAWRSVRDYFNVSEVEVPRFVGMPLEEAQSAAQRVGLGMSVRTQAHSDDYPAGVVASQDQPTGKKVKAGRVVSVVVSLGPELVLVPDVMGQSMSQARETIEVARLAIGKVDETFHDVIERGRIVSQDPPPGAQSPRGSKIAIVMSRGPELIEIPILVGRSLPEARRLLEASGLSITRIQRVLSPDLAPDTVVDQNPPPGTKVKASETRVTLTVSIRPAGPDPSPRGPAGETGARGFPVYRLVQELES